MSQAMISMVPSIRTGHVGVFDRTLRATLAYLSGVRAEWRLRRELRQVEALDARTLADIGIGPGQAEGAVRHGRAGIRHLPTARVALDAAPGLPSSWTEWR